MACIRTTTSPRWTRRLLSTCGALLVVVAASLGLTPAANAGSTLCPSRYVCVFNGASGAGGLGFGAGGAGRIIYFPGRKMIVKNRFTDRAVWSWNGSDYRPETCLDPGDTKDGGSFKGSLAIYIGLAGTRC